MCLGTISGSLGLDCVVVVGCCIMLCFGRRRRRRRRRDDDERSPPTHNDIPYASPCWVVLSLALAGPTGTCPPKRLVL